ncbi:Hsp20/alpha crystallin family protein [Natrialbaceae archaeon A-gly3]
MRLEDVRDSLGSTLYRGIGKAKAQIQEQRSLPVDVLENEDAYLVVFDAPGAEQEDVQVRYVHGTVKVRIDRFREFREGLEMRFPGRGMALDGEVELPEDALVDPETGTARLTEQGTLNIEIPKDVSTDDDGEDADPERIEIDE